LADSSLKWDFMHSFRGAPISPGHKVLTSLAQVAATNDAEFAADVTMSSKDAAIAARRPKRKRAGKTIT
jgi:hypothetical protein